MLLDELTPFERRQKALTRIIAAHASIAHIPGQCQMIAYQIESIADIAKADLAGIRQTIEELKCSTSA